MIEEVWKDYYGWGLGFLETDFVMDIGANIGAFAEEASRRVPGGWRSSPGGAAGVQKM